MGRRRGAAAPGMAVSGPMLRGQGARIGKRARAREQGMIVSRARSLQGGPRQGTPLVRAVVGKPFKALLGMIRIKGEKMAGRQY